MSAEEADRIVRCSTDFFAHDVRMWAGALERYPFVYEKQWPDNTLPIGGEDGVAVLLSLLDPGAVRTPIQWSSDGQGGGGQASSSEVVALFFRSMNGKFQTVDIAAVAEPFGSAAEKLKSLVFGSASEALGSVLLDRFVATKVHPIKLDQPSSEEHVVARAADVAMMLEYLFHEGNSSEIGSRLGMSVAWTLGEGPEQRERIIRTVKTVYDLRSRRAHGAVIGSWDVTAGMTESVILAARLLRRAIVARVLLAGDEAKWKRAFSSARLGALPDRFDQGAGCRECTWSALRANQAV